MYCYSNGIAYGGWEGSSIVNFTQSSIAHFHSAYFHCTLPFCIVYFHCTFLFYKYCMHPCVNHVLIASRGSPAWLQAAAPCLRLRLYTHRTIAVSISSAQAEGGRPATFVRSDAGPRIYVTCSGTGAGRTLTNHVLITLA